jgi:hypothetical protein
MISDILAGDGKTANLFTVYVARRHTIVFTFYALSTHENSNSAQHGELNRVVNISNLKSKVYISKRNIEGF